MKRFNNTTVLAAGVVLGVFLVKKYADVTLTDAGKVAQIKWSW